MGQGLSSAIRNDLVFGVPSLKDHTEWNAAKCLRGEPTAKEMMPDTDLGRCTKPGSRNMVRRQQDVERSFGTPSIRTDIPMKVFRSVADHQNYGDEPEAIDILFPATQLENGVTERDFVKLRPKQELRSLFEKLGYSYRPAKFNAIFNRSVQCSANILGSQVTIPEGQSTTRGMMIAVQEMHNI